MVERCLGKAEVTCSNHVNSTKVLLVWFAQSNWGRAGATARELNQSHLLNDLRSSWDFHIFEVFDNAAAFFLFAALPMFMIGLWPHCWARAVVVVICFTHRAVWRQLIIFHKTSLRLGIYMAV